MGTVKDTCRQEVRHRLEQTCWHLGGKKAWKVSSCFLGMKKMMCIGKWTPLNVIILGYTMMLMEFLLRKLGKCEPIWRIFVQMGSWNHHHLKLFVECLGPGGGKKRSIWQDGALFQNRYTRSIFVLEKPTVAPNWKNKCIDFSWDVFFTYKNGEGNFSPNFHLFSYSHQNLRPKATPPTPKK